VPLARPGDLFAAWLAPSRFWTPRQRRVLEGLAAVRAGGGVVTFVVGNRDYLLAEARAELPVDRVIADEAVMQLGGAPTLVLHGDRANPDDWRYRLWFGLSRSRAVSAVLARLPGPVGASLAARAEATLARTNRAYKTGALPVGPLEALGRRAAALGARRVLVGHFHHDRTLEVAGGVPVQIAPAWLDHRRVLVARSEPDAAGASAPLVSTPLEALLGPRAVS
jgi:UDP-2,3-diacylglucosamine hydrolase